MTDVLREVEALVPRVETAWRGEGRDDDQGIAEWQGERREREERLTRAMRLGRPFDADAWRAETRQALIELAALCIAQVESLDRLNASAPSG